MRVILPEKFAKLPEVQEYVRKKYFINTLITYVIDWKYKNVRVNLSKWIKQNIDDKQFKDIAKSFKGSNDEKIIQILRFVRNTITYVPDKVQWRVEEKWSTPKETLLNKKDDCEGGACLIYALAYNAGIPDHLMRIVAGDVSNGNGHCYLVYSSEVECMEYAIDWCFNYDSNKILLRNYYIGEPEYCYGEQEWFSFNSTESYTSRK